MSCHPTSSRFTPRAATPEERAVLEQHLVTKEGLDASAFGLASECYSAVFDRFMPDGPGYTGKVMLVIHPGGPECVECFTWDKDGKIESQLIDF